MTAKGYNLTWIEFDDDAFDADQPMSCYRSFQCLHDVQHVIDSSGQYRVNIVARVSSFITAQDESDEEPAVLAWEFPLTMMRREYPPNFDVRVAAKIAGGATTARLFAGLYGFNDPHNLQGGPEPGALYYKTTTTTSTVATWAIDEQKLWAEPDRNYMRMRRTYSVSENATHNPVEMVMVRFEVGIDGTYTSAGTSQIIAVQLREFS